MEDDCNACNNTCYCIDNDSHDATCIRNNKTKCLEIIEKFSSRLHNLTLLEMMFYNNISCKTIMVDMDNFDITINGMSRENIMAKFKNEMIELILNKKCYYALSDNKWRNRPYIVSHMGICCKKCNNRSVYS